MSDRPLKLALAVQEPTVTAGAVLMVIAGLPSAKVRLNASVSCTLGLGPAGVVVFATDVVYGIRNVVGAVCVG